MEIKFSNRYVKILTLLLVGLTVFDLIFASSSGWAKFAWTALAYGFLLLVYKLSQLSPGDIGLARKNLLSGLKYGSSLLGIILLAFLIIYLLHKSTLKDPRYHQDLSPALFAALVLLPLKTVFFEELAFRGLMPAIALKIKHSRVFAMAVSSIAYGAWHMVHYQAVLAGNISAPRFLVLSVTFVATAFAGVIFYELRRRSGSLAAPIIAHWAINASAIIFASLSWS